MGGDVKRTQESISRWLIDHHSSFFFFGTVGFETFSLDTMASQRVTYVVSSENMERLARSHGVHLVEPTAAVDQHQQQLLSLMDSSIASASTAADPLVSGYLSGFKPQDMVDFFTPRKTATPSTAVTPGAGGIQQQAANIFSRQPFLKEQGARSFCSSISLRSSGELF